MIDVAPKIIAVIASIGPLLAGPVISWERPRCGCVITGLGYLQLPIIGRRTLGFQWGEGIVALALGWGLAGLLFISAARDWLRPEDCRC